MSDPSVSVLICTKDRPEQLERCLNAVFQLNSSSYEVVVVDNASEHFSVPDVRHTNPTRYFTQPIPGLSYARNLAVRQARAEIVAFIDDDAVPNEDWLTAGLRRFDDPQIGCVTGRVLPLEVKTEWQHKLSSVGWFPDSPESKIYDSSNFNPLSSSPGIGCNFFARKSFFDHHEFSAVFNVGTSVGGEDERYLFHQLIREGWKICYEPAAVVYHEYVLTETQYRRKLSTYSISHSALLTHFLFLEKGHRVQTWKYLLTRLTNRQEGPDVPFMIKAKARFLGPFALIGSILQAKKSRPASLQKPALLAEFTGES